MTENYKNFLFDLYGTLVDIHTEESSPAFWRSVSRLLGMQGVKLAPGALREQYEREIARQEEALRAALPAGAEPEVDLAPIFHGFFEHAGVEADERTVADFARTFRLLSIRRLRLFPGVMGVLDYLHELGKKVYLLSNAQALFTRPELTLLGLDRKLDGGILSSEVGRKKPDPEFFHILMEKYGLDPAETVMVGNDDICDCWGAAKAGLDSFYVCTDQSPELTRPLPENCQGLSQIAELPEFVLPF